MKRSIYIATFIAISSAILASSSCSLLPSRETTSTESETTTTTTTTATETTTVTTTESSESTTTTTETSETTTESSETTVISEQTDESSSSDTNDIKECLFTADNLVKIAKKSGATVYKDADKFVDNFNALKKGNKKAVKKYKNGCAIKATGSDIDKISVIGNQSIQDDDFMAKLTEMGIYMTGDIETGSYTFIVLTFEAEDESLIDAWFKDSSSNFENKLPDQFKSNDLFKFSYGSFNDEGTDSYLIRYVMDDEYAKKSGLPEGSGVHMGVYAQGKHGMIITVVDLSKKQTGIKLMDALCKSMSVRNPQEVK